MKYQILILVCITTIGVWGGTPSKKSVSTQQKVLIQTTAGDIVVKLYNSTPLHRDNFIKLVKSHFYDSLLFHRVISQFMIQGGDPNSKNAPPDLMLGNGDVGYKIPAEFNPATLYHKKGALAAAREGDFTNPEKASSGCQFYIVVGRKFGANELNQMQTNRKQALRNQYFQNTLLQYQSRMEIYKQNGEVKKMEALQDSVMKQIDKRPAIETSFTYTQQQRQTYQLQGGTPHLDGNYTVFGEVTSGLDVVEKIASVKTNSADRPIQDVRIVKMKLIK